MNPLKNRFICVQIEVVADQIPGSIYVREDQVYFINVSDSRTLYRVGTDGSCCELLVPKACIEFVTDAKQYLDADGELHYEESFGTREDGYTYGDFSITLPKFNSELASYKQLNKQMEKLLELALEDKDSFFQEMSELGQDDWNGTFDNNVLVKNLGDMRCYLTPDGIVLCYERYEIMPGAAGSPTFEIPYEWFADIFEQ